MAVVCIAVDICAHDKVSMSILHRHVSNFYCNTLIIRNSEGMVTLRKHVVQRMTSNMQRKSKHFHKSIMAAASRGMLALRCPLQSLSSY